ncbi:SH3 domain-containing protein [Falsigemmobacter faecalis]|uniref:Peptide-binding protein n=1 Tax=Falsigemmobacter faecalis TaxID=2488730 RepID=A0A3P3DRM7_9RHOB|nr:SH3 domain-containing protein [Falsigemmobacter faecalis]RRH76913.1 peptide-binding protein [Falsigemmobacter faecalis]
MKSMFLALSLLPAIAWAEPVVLPELYNVTGVGAGDMLNIRAEPSASAPILGRLAPDRVQIEVTGQSSDGAWAQINAGEGSGWVAMRYLSFPGSLWQSGQLPEGLACFGTEPFWDLRQSGSSLHLRSPDSGEQSYAITSVSDRGFPEDRIRAVQAGDLTAVIFPQDCSDGMSERSFALQVVLSLRGGERPMLSGCCSIAP